MQRGRPLYDNSADAELFVAPRGWEPLVRAIDRGLNVMLTGARGAGKTSLLRQAQLALRGRGESVVFVDAAADVSASELAARLRDALVGRPAPITASFATLRALRPNPSPPPARASQALHDDLSALAGAAKTVVLVDASGSAEAVYGIFGRMRDMLWQFDHAWVVAVDDHERQRALRPPADAFFDAVIELEPTSTDALEEILARREPATPPATRAAIAAAASGSPRAAIRALNDAAIHGRDAVDGLRGRAALTARASQLGRPHGLLMAELLARGQASPSDAALQERLGMSRSRLTSLLRELLDGDLVTAGTERPEGPGRPRTVYRPVGSDL